jgi:1-acyl-sn-glycerol-3-phosphate acyltransferase
MPFDINEMGCRFLGRVLRLVYGFRVIGAENMPAQGPYIALNNEFSFLCIACDAAASATLLLKPFREKKLLTYAGEEFWAMSFTRNFAKVISTQPLLPHGAGQYGLHLLQGLQHLKNGGVIVINPEGDMIRDGRPIPIRDGVAWLGLHSAAPIVPIIVSASAYDIWPTWKPRPSLRGRVVQTVGKPFRLTEEPLSTLTQEDLDRANERIRAEIDALAYGPGGAAAWAGTVVRQPRPVARSIKVQAQPRGPDRAPAGSDGGRAASIGAATAGALASTVTPKPIHVSKRGVALLLWRCPVCGTDDAVAEDRHILRRHHVSCAACGTTWHLRRVPGSDFRLQVIAGAEDLLGLDMPLTAWYDRIKERFQLCPASLPGLDLLPDEQVYLKTGGAVMLLDRAISLVKEGWRSREAPWAELPAKPGDWARLGPGTLWLTNRRFVWDGPPGPLDIQWSRVSAVSLRMYSLFGVHHGSTPYRFWLTQDNALKWLTFAGAVAQTGPRADGRPVTVSPY